MKVIAVTNLKGGTGKSITAANIAYILTAYHNKRVLLVDGDKQGNASHYFKLHDPDRQGLAAVFTDPTLDIYRTVYASGYKGLDVITANMDLYLAAQAEDQGTAAEQASRLKAALVPLQRDYDYCVIDNGPAIDKVAINALVAADDVIIPVRVDDFSFHGLGELADQIAVAQSINPSLAVAGILVTHYQNNDVTNQGMELLRKASKHPVFQTVIHYNKAVQESTFAKRPLPVYNSRSWAAIEYKKLVLEYLAVSNSDTRGYRDGEI